MKNLRRMLLNNCSDPFRPLPELTLSAELEPIIGFTTYTIRERDKAIGHVSVERLQPEVGRRCLITAGAKMDGFMRRADLFASTWLQLLIMSAAEERVMTTTWNGVGPEEVQAWR